MAAVGERTASGIVSGDLPIPCYGLLDTIGALSEIVGTHVEEKPPRAYNISAANTRTFFVRGKSKAANDNDAQAVWVHSCDDSGDKGKRGKYKKPDNLNKRKGADERQKSGARERNLRHPEGEEQSRVAKRPTRRR